MPVPSNLLIYGNHTIHYCDEQIEVINFLWYGYHMATIKEVADRAGVAPITVSRVVNNSGYVSEKTRQRVEAAAAELSYVPNMLARSLRSSRTDLLALVLTDITNPFWTTVARGAEDAASKHGFSVILCNTDEQEAKEERYLSTLLRKRVDGFLYVPASDKAEPIRQIHEQNIPVVVLDRLVAGVDVDFVRSASEDGAYRLVAHLLEMGHRQIAILNGPANVATARERLMGYKRAIAEADIDFHESLAHFGEFTTESGRRSMEQLLVEKPLPTAIFATNNFIAIGAIQALRRNGLRVPQDISVVCFDDVPASYVIEPFLTVVAQPAYEIGRRAAEMLVERITQPHVSEYQDIVFEPELIVRTSCHRID